MPLTTSRLEMTHHQDQAAVWRRMMTVLVCCDMTTTLSGYVQMSHATVSNASSSRTSHHWGQDIDRSIAPCVTAETTAVFYFNKSRCKTDTDRGTEDRRCVRGVTTDARCAQVARNTVTLMLKSRTESVETIALQPSVICQTAGQ